MTNFAIHPVPVTKASGTKPNLIPKENLPVYLRNVECAIRSGGTVQWISVETYPTPENGRTIAIQLQGTFSESSNSYVLDMIFPSAEAALRTPFVMGSFTLQKQPSVYNANHYMSILDSSPSSISIQFDMKDLVWDDEIAHSFAMTFYLH